MSIGRVWSRFGRIRKLRIQDMPKDRGEELTELFLRHYVRDEPFHRATNTARCPETLKLYEDYGKSLSDPNFSCVICCPDDGDEVTDIMGISAMKLTRKYNFSEIDKTGHKPTTKEWETFYNMCKELYAVYNPMEKYNLSTFYDDRGAFVIPQYRGLGIGSELIKTRRLICEAHGVPATGAWVVAARSQTAAARDGWETVFEVPFEELGKRYGVVFTDVPTTVKYMIAKARSNEDREQSNKEEIACFQYGLRL